MQITFGKYGEPTGVVLNTDDVKRLLNGEQLDNADVRIRFDDEARAAFVTTAEFHSCELDNDICTHDLQTAQNQLAMLKGELRETQRNCA